MAFLEDLDGVRIVLGVNDITLGRDESNEVALVDDPRVSRSHAQVVNRDGQWVLADLASKNGTFVNTRRVERHPLRDGDQIQIGDHTWRYHSGSDPHATEAATDAASLAPQPNLTKRELDVLRLVSDGLSDKEVARDLQISVNTVRSHLDRIGEKTGLRRRSELTRLAIGLHLDGER